MADVFTLAQFNAVFPDIVVTQGTLSATQAFMADEVSKATFGTDYVKGLMLLTAHWLTLEKRKGNGQLTSERVGDLSASYQAGSVMRSIEATSFGTAFLRLARRKTGGPGFVKQTYNPALANGPRLQF